MSQNPIEQPIDLRSDTVTKPTERMRRAMFEAEVGDDIYGEDPTANRLEEIAADMLGMDDALFVSSGTMGNLVSVLAHCGRGDEMILGDRSHIFIAEQGGSAALGGVHSRTLRNQPDGTLDLDEVADAIRADNPHYPISRLLCIENTQNFCGGRALSLEYMDAAGALAHQNGLKLHVDGARLFNAAVKLNASPARLLQNADSVSICLSKGLAAPIGSIVAGDQAFVDKARRMRKIVGGATRQAGVIAAAGIVAITEMVERLADDHDNAQKLAKGLSRFDGIDIDPQDVETNLVFFNVNHPDFSASELSAALQERGVLISATGKNRMRAVLNYHISSNDVDRVLDLFKDALEAGPSNAKSSDGAY